MFASLRSGMRAVLDMLSCSAGGGAFAMEACSTSPESGDGRTVFAATANGQLKMPRVGNYCLTMAGDGASDADVAPGAGLVATSSNAEHAVKNIVDGSAQSYWASGSDPAAPVDVQLVDDHVAQATEERGPAHMVGQDAHVQHVRIGDDETAPVAQRAADVAGSIAVVGPGIQRATPKPSGKALELGDLILREGLGREQVQRRRSAVAAVLSAALCVLRGTVAYCCSGSY